MKTTVYTAGKPFLNLDGEDVEEFWQRIQRDFVRRQGQEVLGKRKREEEGWKCRN